MHPNTPIQIGSVAIDPIDYAIRRNGNLGINETGKTYAAGYFAEQLMKRNIPIVVISPSPGKPWRYLKVGREGKQGFPVVVVGDDADLPLSKDSAADIMRAAMQEGVSLVFDLHSRLVSKTEFRHIVTAIVNVLYYENEKYGLRHCFLEEVGDLAPQRIYDKVTYGAVERFVREGGNSKVGVTILNPRAENVNKEVLELCSSLFLFQQTGRNSVKNLSKFFDQMDTSNRDEIIKSFATLRKGQCWYWEAAAAIPVLIQIPEKDTIHPNRREITTGIDSFQGQVMDVTAFVNRMQKVLSKKVIEEQRTSVFAPPVNTSSKEVEQLRLEEAKLRSTIDMMANTNNELLQKIGLIEARLNKVRDMLLPDYERLQALFEEIGNGTEPVPTINTNRYDHWFPQLVGYQKNMLKLFIEHRRLTDQKLALLLGTTSTNGTFIEYRRGLKRKGLIRKEGSEWILVEL